LGLGYKAPRPRPLPSKERAKAQRIPILRVSCQYDTPPPPTAVSEYDIIYQAHEGMGEQRSEEPGYRLIHYKTLAPRLTIRSS